VTSGNQVQVTFFLASSVIKTLACEVGNQGVGQTWRGTKLGMQKFEDQGVRRIMEYENHTTYEI
jgi:hypothetical protein